MTGSVSLCVPFQPSRAAAAFASDNAFASQVSELRIADPEHVSQYLVGMLAERGRGQAVLSRGLRKPHRIGDHLHCLPGGVRHLYYALARPHLWVSEDLLQRVDRAATDLLRL